MARCWLDVGIGDGINELYLAGAQRRQAHRVLTLGLANELVEVGQVVALGIGLPVVFEAYQPGLVEVRPGDELERPCANGMFGSGVEGLRGDQVGRVVHDTGRHGHVWQTRIDTHRVLVEDLDTCNGVHRTTVPFTANGGVFDALDVELHGFRIDLAAVVK
jgi:hypothetical protein